MIGREQSTIVFGFTLNPISQIPISYIATKYYTTRVEVALGCVGQRIDATSRLSPDIYILIRK